MVLEGPRFERPDRRGEAGTALAAGDVGATLTGLGPGYKVSADSFRFPNCTFKKFRITFQKLFHS
jgi:hypothetical protein